MTFLVVTPLSPLPSVDNPYPRSETSHPILKWQPSADGAVEAYDLVIYESLQASYTSGGIYFYSTNLVGKRVYFREGIKEAEHTVEETLPAGRKYFWSVRSHKNNQISPWATYRFQTLGGSGEHMFGFETPS